MIKLTLSEIVAAIGGRPWGDLQPVSVAAASTDSRTVTADELFVAIPGPNFDGHDFVAAALQRGAVAAVVRSDQAARVDHALRQAGVATSRAAVLIETEDTVAALGRLANFHRRQCSAQVIAVVGSNGKTTTKAMIHHVLSGRMPGRCSPKSFNNHIGVPLTLLSSQPGDEYIVVEIGANAPGEIKALGRIAQPDAVALTCIGEEHLEGFGSIEGVAAEECSILETIEPKGFAAINLDHPEVRPRLSAPGVQVTTFGAAADADVRVSSVTYDAPWLHFKLNERFPFRLPMIGAHNAFNAAAAATVARRIGVGFEEAAVRLETFTPPPMRNEILDVGGVTIVNDAYNANPQSAAAAIETLEQLPCKGRRVLVFGEMRELGRHGPALHRRIAERLRASGVQQVILVGAAGDAMYDALTDGGLFGPRVERCDDLSACVERLAATMRPGDVVLLKASRAVELERILAPLRERLGAPAAQG